MKQYLVICKSKFSESDYYFATREVFKTFEDAKKYQSSVAKSLKPKILETICPIKEDIRV